MPEMKPMTRDEVDAIRLRQYIDTEEQGRWLATIRDREARLLERGYCELCWGNCWVPVEPGDPDAVADGMFPGGWKRCDNCWNHNRLLQLDARLRRAVEYVNLCCHPPELIMEIDGGNWHSFWDTRMAEGLDILAENADLLKGESP